MEEFAGFLVSSYLTSSLMYPGPSAQSMVLSTTRRAPVQGDRMFNFTVRILLHHSMSRATVSLNATAVAGCSWCRCLDPSWRIILSDSASLLSRALTNPATLGQKPQLALLFFFLRHFPRHNQGANSIFLEDLTPQLCNIPQTVSRQWVFKRQMC